MIGGKKLVHRAIALAATGLTLGGCASFADTPPQRITPLSGARVTDGDTAYSGILRCMASHTSAIAQPRIAVGEVADYTGRLDGSVAPQGAALMVISALAKAGFPLAERLDLRIALQELDYANSKLLGPDGQPTDDYRRIYSGSIAEADLIVLGGITELDFNIRSDVAEASIGPVGGGGRRRDPGRYCR